MEWQPAQDNNLEEVIISYIKLSLYTDKCAFMQLSVVYDADTMLVKSSIQVTCFIVVVRAMTSSQSRWPGGKPKQHIPMQGDVTLANKIIF